MKCSKCGQDLGNECTFCPNCGSYVFTGQKKYNDRRFDSTPHTPNYYKEKVKKKPVNNNDSSKEAKSEIAVTTSSAYRQDEAPEVKKGSFIKSFILGFFIIIVLLGSASYAGYYAYNHFMGSSTDEYVNSITNLNSQIIKANNDMANIIKKDPKIFPVNDVIKQCYAVSDTFNDISKSYDKIIAPSVYSKSNEKLGEAIKLNKTIYQQLELVLSKPLLPDTQKNIELLSKYIDDCMNNYSAVKVKNISFSLPNEVLLLTSKVQPFVKQKQSEYSQIMSLIASFSKYFDDMAKLFVTYDSAAADFNQTIRAARNGQEKWDKLFSQIDNSEKIIKSVKQDYGKMAVPTELGTINKRFGPILDELLAYYSKLRFAAQTEKDSKNQASDKTTSPAQGAGNTQGTTPDKVTEPQADTKPSTGTKIKPVTVPTTEDTSKKTNDINMLYQEAEKHNSTASLEYQKFAIDLKSEKDKYLDPEFVLKLKSGK